MIGDLVKKYIQDKNLTVAIFARLIRVNTQTIYNWMKGTKIVRKSIAMKVEDVTRGEIPFKKIMGYDRPKKRIHTKSSQSNNPPLN